MRVLFYGAGVIGSLYAARFAGSGIDTTILARGKRLKELNEYGLRIKSIRSKKTESCTNIRIIQELLPDDVYDFIFVAMQKNQLESVLPVLKENKTGNLVFMVNNVSGPKKWADAVGKNRILIAFPGAGGKREEGIVHYHIVSRLIQPTTIGEISGRVTDRIRELSGLVKRAGFHVSISKNIVGWQVSHGAMVCPMGNAVYMDGGNNYTASKNKEAIKLMSLALREAFVFLDRSKSGIHPWKLRVFKVCPTTLMELIMSILYNTKWAETVISNHANVARDEMRMLTQDFLKLAEDCGYDLPYFKKLASYC